MTSLTHAGAAYRTKSLMDRQKADRFAACLRQNRRFTNVAVCESPRAKSPVERYYVRYEPSSESRRQALLEAAENQRLLKAGGEGQGYVFCLDTDERFFWCLSTSGEVYEVTEQSCTCPDHQYRCRPAGIRCKHVLALVNGWGTRASWE